MAKKTKETTSIATTEQDQVPAWMQEDADVGMDLMKEFVQPSRLKLIQPLSGEKFKDHGDDGDVLLLPQMVNLGEVFHFTPVFFFPEWLAVNPREATQLNMVRERSFDAESLIAVKSRNEKTRKEECPEMPEKNITFQEVLNYVVVISDGPCMGIAAVMSFSKAEHRTGTALASLIKIRKAPLFGCVFKATVGFRTDNPAGKWYGFDITNPDPDDESTCLPFVNDQDIYAALKQQHETFASAFEKRIIVVDHNDSDLEDEPKDSPEEF